MNKFCGHLLTPLIKVCEDHRLDYDQYDQCNLYYVNPASEECAKLFAGFLTHSDKGSAAEVLVEQFDFLRDKNWLLAFDIAFQVIALFGRTDEKGVLDQAHAAYNFLFAELHEKYGARSQRGHRRCFVAVRRTSLESRCIHKAPVHQMPDEHVL